MRISDWSSDVCSSDLGHDTTQGDRPLRMQPDAGHHELMHRRKRRLDRDTKPGRIFPPHGLPASNQRHVAARRATEVSMHQPARGACRRDWAGWHRSEEPTSELQSLMRISYAVFCLKKKR